MPAQEIYLLGLCGTQMPTQKKQWASTLQALFQLLWIFCLHHSMCLPLSKTHPLSAPLPPLVSWVQLSTQVEALGLRATHSTFFVKRILSGDHQLPPCWWLLTFYPSLISHLSPIALTSVVCWASDLYQASLLLPQKSPETEILNSRVQSVTRDLKEHTFRFLTSQIQSSPQVPLVPTQNAYKYSL